MFENPPVVNLSSMHLCQTLKKKKDFPVAQTIKTLPAMQEIKVRSLGQEDPRRSSGWDFPLSLPRT